MVRLKPKKAGVYLPFVPRSQFHYGSIKTIIVEKKGSGSDLSQFHYGSIKTTLGKEINPFEQASQFHYGSIKTKKTVEVVMASYYVSIPLWFD